MLTVFWDFAFAATVMAAWVGVAFILAFFGTFVLNLIGDWVYGKRERSRR